MGEKPGNPFEVFAKIEDSILVLILVAMIFLAFLQIVLRNVFGVGLIWVEPLVRQMLLWVALAGAMVATRDHNHITVDAVSRFLPPGRIKYASGFAAGNSSGDYKTWPEDRICSFWACEGERRGRL